MEINVLVIGGGAAGVMAAIEASREGASVVIIEHIDKPLKKILSTGNGKCNFTNSHMDVDCFRGKNNAFVVEALKAFSSDMLISFFKELGIYPKEKNGYYYPHSEQASSVRDCLLMELEKQNVVVKTEEEIIEISKLSDEFEIFTNKGKYCCKKVIVATGLLAGRKVGCDGSINQHLEKLGHSFIDIVPSLVQLKSDDSFIKNLAGNRADVRLVFKKSDQNVYSDRGELLFLKDGLSGIVTFQGSRYVSYGLREGKKMEVHVDFLPDLTVEEVYNELYNRAYINGTDRLIKNLLIGLLPELIALNIIKKANLSPDRKCVTLTDKELIRVRDIVKTCIISINGTRDFADCQVCAGGICTDEIDEYSMESKIVNGLYFAGELIDIDGKCGGYNLQWAFSSGYLAGKNAARETLC